MRKLEGVGNEVQYGQKFNMGSKQKIQGELKLERRSRGQIMKGFVSVVPPKHQDPCWWGLHFYTVVGAQELINSVLEVRWHNVFWEEPEIMLLLFSVDRNLL